MSQTVRVTALEAEQLISPVLEHMGKNRPHWHFVKEDNPLQYSIFLNDFFEEVHHYCLKDLDHYTEWIKPRGWCHKVILQREQLNYCPHLMGEEHPSEDMERPSESIFHSYWVA